MPEVPTAKTGRPAATSRDETGWKPVLRRNVVRLLQRSSEVFRGVFAKFLFEHRWIGEFSRVGARQRDLEGLMSTQCIEQGEEACLVG